LNEQLLFLAVVLAVLRTAMQIINRTSSQYLFYESSL